MCSPACLLLACLVGLAINDTWASDVNRGLHFRLVMEAGTKAFLSYMRAYKEHHCRFIFRLQVGWQGCQCAITLPVRPGREG